MSNNIRTLDELWKEWTDGIDGRKPAAKLTTAERNSDKGMKQKYWRRSRVWECIERFVNAGQTPEDAMALRQVLPKSLS